MVYLTLLYSYDIIAQDHQAGLNTRVSAAFDKIRG